MTTTPKRIPIPRDLVPGDVVMVKMNNDDVVREWTVHRHVPGARPDSGDYQLVRPGRCHWFCCDGWSNIKAGYAVRIIRKASKPKRKLKPARKPMVAWVFAVEYYKGTAVESTYRKACRTREHARRQANSWKGSHGVVVHGPVKVVIP
jgi:hypothetical protein